MMLDLNVKFYRLDMTDEEYADAIADFIQAPEGQEFDLGAGFNESNISDINATKSLLLLKGRIDRLKSDIDKIDTETAKGRLTAMYNQVDRLLNEIK